MHRAAHFSLAIIAALLLVSTFAFAGDHDPANFPLRVHLFQHTGVSHYTRQMLDTVDGEGRANLFENGEVHAFDYTYRCSFRLMDSPGFETYPARWKKPGRTLEILMPVVGKPGAGQTCELKVEMKEGMAYVRRTGGLGMEPASEYKEWMEKHQYDPEHGKNQPVGLDNAPARPAPAAPAPAH